jgi:hypothetical protein
VTNGLHPPDFLYFRRSGLSVLKMSASLLVLLLVIVVNCCQQSSILLFEQNVHYYTKKVKLSPKQATKAQREDRGIALLFL